MLAINKTGKIPDFKTSFDGPMAKTLCFQCRGLGSIPGQGIKISHIATKDLACCSKDERSRMLQI